MNDLQSSLLLIGGIAIIATLGFNFFQDKRAKKQGSLQHDHSDIDPLLHGDVRLEPTGQFNEQVQQAYQQNLGNRILDQELDNGVMEKIFGFVYLSLEQPVSVTRLSAELNSLNKAGKKNVYIYATLANEEDNGWVPIGSDQTVSNLRFTLPLTNRKGSLTAIEYSEFLNKVQPLADVFGSHLEFPDMNELLVKADRLDKLAANLDAIFGLHCVLPVSAELTSLESDLRSKEWYPDGRHWTKGSADSQLATVVIHEAPGKRVLSFNIDLPNCADPIGTLHAIAELGNEFATKYEGTLMDDAGRPLTANAFITIQNQMIERSQALKEAGFKPGNMAAKIIFS